MGLRKAWILDSPLVSPLLQPISFDESVETSEDNRSVYTADGDIPLPANPRRPVSAAACGRPLKLRAKRYRKPQEGKATLDEFDALMLIIKAHNMKPPRGSRRKSGLPVDIKGSIRRLGA